MKSEICAMKFCDVIFIKVDEFKAANVGWILCSKLRYNLIIFYGVESECSDRTLAFQRITEPRNARSNISKSFDAM